MKKRKCLYVICFVTVLLLNIFYVNYEFYILMLLAVLIPLFSLVAFLLGKYHIELMFRVPDRRMIQGQRLPLQVKTENHVPILLANSDIHYDICFSNDQQKIHQVTNVDTFLDMRKKGTRIETNHSGFVEIQAEKIVMYDYLKLFKKQKRYKGHMQVSIFPELLPQSERNHSDYIDGVEFSNEQWTILSGDSDEIIDFREYQSGDSMNKIHWKLSMKMDEMIVKKYGDVDDRCIRILVDLSKNDDENFRSNLDKIYQMAYSIGHYYVRREKKASFIVWDSRDKKLAEYTFSSDDELSVAMLLLMQQKCGVDVGSKTEAAFEESRLKMAERPYWITTMDNDSREYQVVNVVKDDLNQIMETLYEI